MSHESLDCTHDVALWLIWMECHVKRASRRLPFTGELAYKQDNSTLSRHIIFDLHTLLAYFLLVLVLLLCFSCFLLTA